MARTAIQAQANNVARVKVAAHFESVVNAKFRLVARPPTRRTAIGGCPKSASYDMLGEQLHYSNPVKHGRFCFFGIRINFSVKQVLCFVTGLCTMKHAACRR